MQLARWRCGTRTALCPPATLPLVAGDWPRQRRVRMRSSQVVGGTCGFARDRLHVYISLRFSLDASVVLQPPWSLTPRTQFQ
jgi:hypothetical protein